jgi:hypothetical protein
MFKFKNVHIWKWKIIKIFGFENCSDLQKCSYVKKVHILKYTVFENVQIW